ncbi:MAG: hypothetical protein MZV70_05945 [Desulfobacterales bacterium]|nr:hypothetical protein [Desulfobacterales bacterium]
MSLIASPPSPPASSVPPPRRLGVPVRVPARYENKISTDQRARPQALNALSSVPTLGHPVNAGSSAGR